MFDATKELFLLNSKIAFLKSAQNEAEIGPFFNGVQCSQELFQLIYFSCFIDAFSLYNYVDPQSYFSLFFACKIPFCVVWKYLDLAGVYHFLRASF